MEKDLLKDLSLDKSVPTFTFKLFSVQIKIKSISEQSLVNLGSEHERVDTFLHTVQWSHGE